MKILGIRLASGEELLAKAEQRGGYLVVKDPIVVVLVPQQGKVGIDFAPWTLIAQDEIPLREQLVLSSYPVTKEVEDIYLQVTTGLQIATAAPSQILKG